MNSIDLKQHFIAWYENEFRLTRLWDDMLATTEDTKFHREENVAVHIGMVLEQYFAMVGDGEWSVADYMGAVMCAMHDIAKPRTKFFCAKSNHNRFTDHDYLSGMMWLEYMQTNNTLHEVLSPDDIYNIAVMIQCHTPFRFGSELSNMVMTHMVHTGTIGVFVRCIIADTYGRISDDPVARDSRMSKWVLDTIGIDVADAHIGSLAYYRIPLKTNIDTAATLYIGDVPVDVRASDTHFDMYSFESVGVIAKEFHRIHKLHGRLSVSGDLSTTKSRKVFKERGLVDVVVRFGSETIDAMVEHMRLPMIGEVASIDFDIIRS